LGLERHKIANLAILSAFMKKLLTFGIFGLSFGFFPTFVAFLGFQV
jgi:hypothetical protein